MFFCRHVLSVTDRESERGREKCEKRERGPAARLPLLCASIRRRVFRSLSVNYYVPVYGEHFFVYPPQNWQAAHASFIRQDGNCITDFIVTILDSRLVFLPRLVSGRAGPVRSSRRSQRELLRLSPYSASKK